MTPLLTTPPSGEPLTVAELKSWLRISTSDEDDVLQSLIVSARMTIEAYVRRFCMTQVWRLRMDGWPPSIADATPSITLPLSPFQSVVAIRTYDAASNVTTLDPQNFYAPSSPDCARITFVTAPQPPARKTDGVEIDLKVGYGDLASDTPAPLRKAMTMLVARWYENRGDVDAGDAHLPAQVLALAQPFRRERLQ